MAQTTVQTSEGAPQRQVANADPPLVSVVIPARNEAQYIEHCLRSFIQQDYPADRLEIIVVDGMSDDGTFELVERIAERQVSPNLKVIANPERVTPWALNRGIQAAAGEVIVIFGAHSVAQQDYVRLAVRTLAETGAGAVGGRWVEIGQDYMGGVIGTARKSRIGGALSAHRYSDQAGFVDTVRFAAYRREVFRAVGLFDPELVRNQDDEFNYRVRAGGFRLFFNPNIISTYYARGTLSKLFRQMYQYGYWKPRVIQKVPKAFQLQFFVPLLFVISIIVLGLGSIAFRCCRWILGPELVAYLTLTMTYAFLTGRPKGFRYQLGILASYWVIHTALGLGTLVGLKKLLSPLAEPPAYDGVHRSHAAE